MAYRNASFVFIHSGHKGRRPHIALKNSIDGFDVIEIDYDKDGLTTNGVSVLSEWEPDMLIDYSRDIPGMIAVFLRTDGAAELILPNN